MSKSKEGERGRERAPLGRSLATPAFFFPLHLSTTTLTLPALSLSLSLSLSFSLSLCSTPLLPLYKTTTNQPNSAATDVEIEDSPPPVEYFETFGSLEKKVAR